MKAPDKSLQTGTIVLSSVFPILIALSAYGAVNQASIIHFVMLWFFKLIALGQIPLAITDMLWKKQQSILFNISAIFLGVFVGFGDNIFADVPNIESRLLWIATFLYSGMLMMILWLYFSEKKRSRS